MLLSPLLELSAGHARLANDGLQCAGSQLHMVWNRHGARGAVNPLLHDDVAALAAHFQKPVPGKNGADLRPG